jgi:hypothetical protein
MRINRPLIGAINPYSIGRKSPRSTEISGQFPGSFFRKSMLIELGVTNRRHDFIADRACLHNGSLARARLLNATF